MLISNHIFTTHTLQAQRELYNALFDIFGPNVPIEIRGGLSGPTLVDSVIIFRWTVPFEQLIKPAHNIFYMLEAQCSTPPRFFLVQGVDYNYHIKGNCGPRESNPEPDIVTPAMVFAKMRYNINLPQLLPVFTDV